jgi:hypothetical protein
MISSIAFCRPSRNIASSQVRAMEILPSPALRSHAAICRPSADTGCSTMIGAAISSTSISDPDKAGPLAAARWHRHGARKVDPDGANGPE